MGLALSSGLLARLEALLDDLLVGQADERLGEGRRQRLAVAIATLVEEQLAEAQYQRNQTFLATLSHELRTPLNGIMGMATLLRDSGLNPVQRDHLEQLQRSADSLLAMISDMLELPALESGDLSFIAAPFNPHDALMEVVGIFAQKAADKGLAFAHLVYRDVPTHVVGDAARFRQLLVHLLRNAVRFTEAGEVIVRVKREPGEGGRLRVEVTDTGVGIPPEDHSRIFEPFTQLDSSSTRRFGGVGNGLAIARRLVTAMQGELGLESVEGRGSTFYFAVPLVVAEVVAEAAPVAPPPPQTPEAKPAVVPAPESAPPSATVSSAPSVGTGPWGPSEPAPGADKLLVVEDNRLNQRVAVGVLERLGYAADVVDDGLQALAAIANTPYQAILMDCHMPRMDGLTATREIRRLEAGAARIPIIALTANAGKEDEARCLDAGMDAFLTKPLRPNELQVTLSRYLAPNGPGRILVAGALPEQPSRPPSLLDDANLPDDGPLDRAALEGLRDLQTPGEPDVLEELVTIFLNDSPRLMRVIARGVPTEGLGELREALHALRGTAGNIGAIALGQLCGEVEEQCAREDRIGLARKLVKVGDAFLAARKALGALLKAPRPRLLAAEDAGLNRKLLGRILEGIGYEVEMAADGQEALDAAEVRFFDAVVLDCHMPNVDGFEAARRLRSMAGPIARAPIVALTASDGAGERAACLEAGMDDFLTKPVAAEQLQLLLACWIPLKSPREAERERATFAGDESPAPVPAESTPQPVEAPQGGLNEASFKLASAPEAPPSFAFEVSPDAAAPSPPRPTPELLTAPPPRPSAFDGVKPAARTTGPENPDGTFGYGDRLAPEALAVPAPFSPAQSMMPLGSASALDPGVVLDPEVVAYLKKLNDGNGLADAASMFLAEVPGLIWSLGEAIESESLVALRTAAASLQAGANAIGARHLAATCGAIVIRCGLGDLAGAARRYTQAQAELADVRTALESEAGSGG